MKHRKLRIAWSVVFGAIAFSVIHFTAGIALGGAWGVLGRDRSIEFIKKTSDALLTVWWFPVVQIYRFFNLHNGFLIVAFSIAGSLLWGSVIFSIWRANQEHDFKLSRRFLLIFTTVFGVLLGIILCLVIL